MAAHAFRPEHVRERRKLELLQPTVGIATLASPRLPGLATTSMMLAMATSRKGMAVSYTHLTLPTICSV
eukprot:11212941-Alexandrium_andersonii.AAC.1